MRIALISLVLALGLHCSQAQTSIQTKPQQLTPAKPESVGMSSERFRRIETFLQGEVDQKRLPGSMMIVARKGKIVYHNAVGYDDMDAKTPLGKDQIFRIMSMSKALTTTAVMILYEEGRIDLDDPLSKYIPEFSNPKVLVHYNEKDTTYAAVPAKKVPTIRHLLSHTAGIPYTHPLYYKAGIPDFFSTKPITIAQTMPKLAALPLLHEPGEKYTYGLNTDMLGYLVEVVSGMRFGDFLQKRIFDPLGMNDTGFYVKKGQESRLMIQYTDDSLGLRKHPVRDEEIYPICEARSYESGGAGLTSTTLDYAKFLQMLLNGGSFNNQQILGRKTVELMCRNQIGDLDMWGTGNQFSFGFEIITEKGGGKKNAATVGALRWGGRNGSDYIFDPTEELLIVWTMQVVPSKQWSYTEKVRRMVYQCLVD
jgi:CubicO group peptidase (beta-lactamase class C family)